MREWLAIRRLRLYENAERAFANSISQTAMQLSFVKRARVELQTSLGGRKGAGGVDVAGALRESDDDIVGWQLRGYAAEHGSKGLNTGLFYRRVVGGALAGVNIFADYEDGDNGDFWRWSVGGDVKNRFGEISANHYFAITDAQVVGGKTAYTREGYDVDLALRIPRLEWAKARVGYYNFKGEFGDEDENGFRAGLDLSPGDGLVVGVEYDDDDGKFGGNISYTHAFGEISKGAQRAGDFNPRAHFYDSARREYSQRISRTSGGGGEVVNVNSAINVGVFGGDNFTALTITNGSFQLPATGAVTATTSTDAGNATLRQGWELVIGSNAQIEFRRGPTATLAVTGGSGTFNRNNANITLIQMGGADITLLGTRFDFEVNGGNVNITLREGGLGIPASGVSVVPAQGVTVVRAGVTMYCGGTNMPENCSFGMAATSADVMTAITAPAANDVTIGQFVIAQREGDIGASVSGAGFSLMRNGANLNILISSEAAAIPNADAKRATLHLTDTAGLLSSTVSMVVFAARVNSPDSVFGMTATGADVVTEVTAPAAGNVIVGRYVLAQRHGDITASVSGAGFLAMTSQMSIINVLISQAAAATPDVNLKRVTLHLTDMANLLLPPVSAAVFTMRVNPSSIDLRFVGNPNTAPLTMAGDIIIGTLEVTNGFGAQSITFDGNGGSFRLEASDAANRRLLILGGNNSQARTVSVVALGNDNVNDRTPAATLSVAVTVEDALRVDGGDFTILADTSSSPIITISASGGERPHNYSATETPSGTHPAVAASGSGPYTISKTGTPQAAADLRWIYQVTDNRGSVEAATVDITIAGALNAQFNIGAVAGDVKGLGGGAVETGTRHTIGTISGSGGVGDYHILQVPANFEIAESTILVAQFNNIGTASYNFVVDDANAPITEPVTLAVSITALAPLRTIDGILLTIHTGSSPAGIIREWQPTGGNARTYSPSYRIGTIPGGFDFPLHSAGGVNNLVRLESVDPGGGAEPVSIRLFFTGNRAPLTTGTLVFETIEVVDGSSPSRRTGLASPLSIILVNPPPVTVSVNQTVNSTSAGASSVAVATLTYSGGSTGGALTATVVGVKDGFGAVSDNEVLMSASAAGEVIATINAYDSTNATAPNATAQITVTFTGGG